MKSRTSSALGIALTVVFLLTTIGIPVTKHICRITGHTDVALYANEDFHGCCPMEDGMAKSGKEKPGCCNHEQQFLQLNFIYSPEKIAVWKVRVPSITTIASVAHQVNDIPQRAATRFANSNLPPPEQGADRLVRLATFLC